MEAILTAVSKYIILLVFAIYTLFSFSALIPRRKKWRVTALYYIQTLFTFLFLSICNLVLFYNTYDKRYVILLLLELCYILLVSVIFQRIYIHASRALCSSMCMLLSVGFVIQSRLNISSAIKQYVVALIAIIISAFIPVIVKKFKTMGNFGLIYGAVGCLALALVAFGGKTEYGAKLSLSFGAFSIQPTEFVKISFVFCVAACLKDGKFLNVVKTVAIAGIHIVILAICKDLGAAFIFLVGLLFMVFVATRNPLYLLIGGGGGVFAGNMAIKMFPHIQKRFIAWEDPLSVADGTGYQLCQSLFAISSGSWEGRGLLNGMPNKIPIVSKDFVFSAICEEMGVLFGVLLILVYMCSILMMFSLATRMKEKFYKVMALGFGTMYATQILLCIGGNIKFIPSTGVTLPFVSYGGSSLLSTLLMFSIIQGVYEISHDEEAEVDKKKRRKLKSGMVKSNAETEDGNANSDDLIILDEAIDTNANLTVLDSATVQSEDEATGTGKVLPEIIIDEDDLLGAKLDDIRIEKL